MTPPNSSSLPTQLTVIKEYISGAVCHVCAKNIYYYMNIYLRQGGYVFAYVCL